MTIIRPKHDKRMNMEMCPMALRSICWDGIFWLDKDGFFPSSAWDGFLSAVCGSSSASPTAGASFSGGASSVSAVSAGSGFSASAASAAAASSPPSAGAASSAREGLDAALEARNSEDLRLSASCNERLLSSLGL